MPIAQWHKMLCRHNCKSFLVNLYCHIPVEETLFSNRNLIFERNYFEKRWLRKLFSKHAIFHKQFWCCGSSERGDSREAAASSSAPTLLLLQHDSGGACLPAQNSRRCRPSLRPHGTPCGAWLRRLTDTPPVRTFWWLVAATLPRWWARQGTQLMSQPGQVGFFNADRAII